MSKETFPELINALSSLNSIGFTRLQAATYVALLKMGEETGSAIAKESGINRSKIYDILEKLMEMGVVHKIPREGKIKYKAQDPHTVLDKIKDNFVNEIQNSKSKLLSIMELREDIDEVNISLIKLYLKDLNLNEFEYLISTREKSRTDLIELLNKENRPGKQVKILNLNDQGKERGTILLMKRQLVYLFNTPVGQSVDCLQITSKELIKVFYGIVESQWKNDLPVEMLNQINTGRLPVLHIGKSLSMEYLIKEIATGKEHISQAYERPVSFILTDDYLSFIYSIDNIDDPKIMLRFVTGLRMGNSNNLYIEIQFHNGNTGRLRIQPVENVIYLYNLIRVLTSK